jgi:iron complex transport system ATP-binding protein
VAEHVRLAYDELVVVDDLSLVVPDGHVTAIVGANACGKSTLLRALGRLLAPERGAVLLDGQEIHRLRSKDVARRLGLLPQGPIAPDGIVAGDLVALGRSPHQSLFQRWSSEDERAVAAALEATHTADLADRPVDELSGGQRQRVWIAMALAQETPLLLLDEPTTFLDVAHQMEVLELIAELNRDGRTIVLVLHDLNQACRYADHVVAMREGAIVAAGPPAEIVTPELVHDVFGVGCVVIADPLTGGPLVVPRRPTPSASTPSAADETEPLTTGGPTTEPHTEEEAIRT